MYHIFVQDRESEKWFYTGTTGFYMDREYIGSSNRTKKVMRFNSFVSPIPEKVSAFIKAHKIIKAETKEEAWLILNSK
jgi:hypothetical protein